MSCCSGRKKMIRHNNTRRLGWRARRSPEASVVSKDVRCNGWFTLRTPSCCEPRTEQLELQCPSRNAALGGRRYRAMDPWKPCSLFNSLFTLGSGWRARRQHFVNMWSDPGAKESVSSLIFVAIGTSSITPWSTANGSSTVGGWAPLAALAAVLPAMCGKHGKPGHKLRPGRAHELHQMTSRPLGLKWKPSFARSKIRVSDGKCAAKMG